MEQAKQTMEQTMEHVLEINQVQVAGGIVGGKQVM
jgi:hypothetical protein